ncbi:MAG: hypothetical protein WCI54_16595 [Bacteroidia bacterium]
MKTKVFLFVCLFLGIGLTQLSAQDFSLPKNGENGSVTSRFTTWYWLPVYIDGVMVDELSGDVEWHIIIRYKNGAMINVIDKITGISIQSKTGENFTGSEIDRQNIEDQLGIWHFNLKGNQGTHYIGTLTQTNWDNPPGGVITVIRVNYPNGPKIAKY